MAVATPVGPCRLPRDAGAPPAPPVRATHVHVRDGREAPAGGPWLDGGHPGLHGHVLRGPGRLGSRDHLIGFICTVNRMVGVGVRDRNPRRARGEGLRPKSPEVRPARRHSTELLWPPETSKRVPHAVCSQQPDPGPQTLTPGGGARGQDTGRRPWAAPEVPPVVDAAFAPPVPIFNGVNEAAAWTV